MTHKFIFLIYFLLFTNLFGNNNNAFNVNLTQEERNWLKANPTITLGSDEQWTPYIIKEKDGNISGYDQDILDLVNKNTGANFKIVAGSWNDMLNKAKKKEIDGLSTSAIHESRKELFNFSKVYISSKKILIVANNNPKNIKSLDDLKGKRLAYQKSNLFDKKLAVKYTDSVLVPLGSLEEILTKLIKGEVDAIIGSYTLIYLANKLELPYIKIIDFIPNSTINLVFSLRKDYPEALSILNKGLASISKSEKLSLDNKWFFNKSEKIISLEKNMKLFLNFTNEEEEYLKEKKEIKICVLPNWLPFEQIDENGKHKGIGADIMNLTSKLINLPITLVPTKSWLESLENIRNRKCDVLPVAMDIPSRKMSMNFTRPYSTEPFVIATKLNQLFIKDSKSIGNKKVGIVKGYAFINVLRQRNPSIKIIEVKNAEEGLRKVQNKELFGYIDIMPAIGYNMQKHGMYDLKIAGKLEFDIKLSIASRNDEPLLNSIMQKSLDKINEEELRTILKRWIEIKVEEIIDYSKILYLSAFFIIILLLVIYKNRSINIINKKLTIANNEIFEQQKMVNKYVLIISTDLKGIITDANEAYCKVLGYKKEELLGKTHKIMRHEDTSVEILKDIWNTIENDKAWIGKLKNYTKNRKVKYFNIYMEPLYIDNKKVGYRSISEDITDKNTFEELNKYQKSILSFFDKGDTVLFKWKNDDSKSIEYVSESIYKLSGYQSDEFINKNMTYRSLVNKEDWRKTNQEFKNAILRKEDYIKHDPYRIKTKDGKEKWILDNTVLLYENGIITHYLGYMTDITEHLLQQRMIFQQSRTSAIGEMIGNIAHQWRQPLSVISTVATGLKLNLEFDENLDKKEITHNLDKINKHTQHLSCTIDDFRNFFKDNLNTVEHNNLKDTIKRVRELTIDSFNSNFIEYSEDIENVSHDYNENIFIQALLNIYNNAKDALSDKKSDRYFNISIKKEEKGIILRIKDNGGGIKDDLIEKIFEPYFTTKHESIGTGIGLYMTNQIMTKQFKGSIFAHNIEFQHKDKVYKGIEFVLTIPFNK
ncbi:transporter substrate-binding domain-containing protein [Poseidonibacter lekithochrous]|uniref:transporter substrate-binding domain-containing protein n=1 Tax=Poseidonibacter TaxID=2321187 RepID=UPI001C089BCB|nr:MULTISPECIES: transporter substrate-binding domain-containing protein [Poseidonibacter]MBU3015897.1 transporter substrate-binding domain-containing protein [Poseidonibacter lekithochrous]MDO6829196.1 transporter substrate-binding domain-containing protein [Poseidonibacter sp. 1_MG-2023]